ATAPSYPSFRCRRGSRGRCTPVVGFKASRPRARRTATPGRSPAAQAARSTDRSRARYRGHGAGYPETVMPFGAAPSEVPTSLDAFLASVEGRAYRLAELALGHREDALDTVQESMVRLVAYRDRPPAEWAPLFWSILRRQLTDRHRRNAVRNKVMAVLGRSGEQREDPLELMPDPGEDPAAHLDRQRAWNALGEAVRQLPRRQREAWLLRE